MSRKGVTLTPAREAVTPLGGEDIPLIALTRNDKRLIRAFLAHYRSLGVTRFIIVDDGSSDGTRKLLSGEPDVDLYLPNVRYGEAYRGRLWRQMLVRSYGRNRWYLNVDSDEFLILPWQRGLRELSIHLEASGITHLAAPMLDMYPPGRVRQAEYVYSEGRMPWHIATLFDGTGYQLTADSRAWSLKGGVRQRCFGSDAQLMKYPFMRWGPFTRLDKSVHFPNPYWNNFVPPTGVLLHFKFFADFRESFQAVIDNAQHFEGSSVYRHITDRIGDPDRLVLEYPASVEFTDGISLAKKGFVVAPSSRPHL